MKEEYIKPEIECIMVDCEGVIAGSDTPGADDPLDPSSNKSSSRGRSRIWDDWGQN